MMASACERNISLNILRMLKQQSITQSGAELWQKMDSLITLPDTYGYDSTWTRSSGIICSALSNKLHPRYNHLLRRCHPPISSPAKDNKRNNNYLFQPKHSRNTILLRMAPTAANRGNVMGATDYFFLESLGLEETPLISPWFCPHHDPRYLWVRFHMDPEQWNYMFSPHYQQAPPALRSLVTSLPPADFFPSER
ncbi:unnamed protein product [Bemisia tabaci]|uniref:Uncharacterized protein n=1 Tax=Bemisia tabaci TaxID=7038 RepID=A0A9P0F9J8_BEMTA|nr:unnamed protein product [Bemisia tabaci]